MALRLNRTAKRKKSGVKPPHSKSNPIDCSKLVSNKQHILRRITEVAKKLGRAPSLLEFVALSEISRYSISSCFPKWNDAVREAGLHPRRLRVRPEDDELLKDWGKTVRRKRTLPSRRAYLLGGRHEPRTLEKRFDGWEFVPQAFRKFAKGKPEWADVVALLPAAAPTKAAERPRSTPASPVTRRHAGPALPKDRATYGNPMNFHGLRHEPVNEQGVVLLFGMLAKELGYMVEAVQTGFPDCEAKRQIGPDRWQRVRIEFEFESRNFRDHGHPSNGCDIIVCWRHNWHDCPEHLQILELSNVIKSLANPED